MELRGVELRGFRCGTERGGTEGDPFFKIKTCTNKISIGKIVHVIISKISWPYEERWLRFWLRYLGRFRFLPLGAAPLRGHLLRLPDGASLK